MTPKPESGSTLEWQPALIFDAHADQRPWSLHPDVQALLGKVIRVREDGSGEYVPEECKTFC
ncbi:MAG TPA: hypothetical protein VN647_08885, partial [Nitrospira sp.]|nr:hypothetical protein [Nitrospira sp.]